MVMNIIIAGLQVFFVIMNFTVEQEYCRGPLDPNSSVPFVKESVDFTLEHNPLFVERPEWLVKATCLHGYFFWILYAVIFYLAVTDGWYKASNTMLTRLFVPVFVGAKLNAIFFYHYMEFTSHAPPPNLLPYFSAEGGYIVSIGLVLYKLASEETKGGKQD